MKNRHNQGFRLQYLEIYNWGTFDELIWKLEPKGKNSLLTGANGSGKTTLVDAIITLLVPPNNRHYNQSSGTKSKRERDEKTYTMGAYVTVQEESGLAAKTKHLRTKDEFSILLGTFYNSDHKEYVTLTQVRWFANNELKRAYFITPSALTIAEHLQPLDTGGLWKKALKKKHKAEEFTSFSKYSQRFSKLFGLKSEKALTLFAQTVGIKVLGNLNDFIRHNMLEEHDAEQEFLKLYEHYESLLRAHKAIEKAREQLLLLSPIVDGGNTFYQLQQEVQKAEHLSDSVTPYFAQEKKQLFERNIQILRGDVQKKSNQIEELKAHITNLDNQRSDLQVSISTDKAYEQIQNLDKQIQQSEQELARREQQANRYNRIAKALDYEENPNEKKFYKTIKDSEKEISVSEERLQQLQDTQVQHQIEIDQKRLESGELEVQLKSLQTRQNRIPMAQIQIREQLLMKLELDESALPFGAELFKIKEDAKYLEAVIEQGFRSLGLSILVRKSYYPAVLNAVHRLKINGKIRFYQIPDTITPLSEEKYKKNSILQKISFKPNNECAYWLEKFIAENYNYELVKGVASLQKTTLGLSEKGILKNDNYHERDDREARLAPQNFILGWENKSTILLMQRQLKAQHEAILEVQKRLKKNQIDRHQLNQKRDYLVRLISFDQFAAIDWKGTKKEGANFEKEKSILLKSSNQLNELERQLKQVKSAISEQEKSKDRLIEQRGNLQNRIANHEQQLIQAKEVTDQYKSATTSEDQKAILAFLPADQSQEFTTTMIDKVERFLHRTIQQERDKKTRHLSSTERKLTLAMQKFIAPSQVILDEYPNWTAETNDLMPDVNYLPQFEDMHRKIAKDDLPKYQKRFKDWLNERMIFDIANFKTALENQEVQILESIEEINASLLDIDFNRQPKTYIQLDIKKTRDHAVRDFKEMIRNAMPDPAKLIKGDEAELEKSFKKIKKIIEELASNEAWRKKVTDVRNWLEFAADERYREDNTQRQYYVDSQSLSGGEKAKLAYTILASAIAYQFGIRNEGRRAKSFRFAVVDEAFSKVDPENSVYAMELFKQLNLQLMVVTPLDKINLAEPYIHSVHFVENREKRNSQVYDLSMKVYEEQKEAFKEAVT